MHQFCKARGGKLLLLAHEPRSCEQSLTAARNWANSGQRRSVRTATVERVLARPHLDDIRGCGVCPVLRGRFYPMARFRLF